MTDRREEEGRWLADAARPGRSALRWAAACQVLETVATVVQWAGVAWVADAVLDGHGLTGVELGVLGTGGVLAAAAAWGGSHFQAIARRWISGAVRRRLVDVLVPTRQRQDVPDAAVAALATIELADDVADHHAQAVPLRLSAPVSMAVVLVVTAVVQWPAAVILLLATLLIPLNMRLAGLFAQQGADERVEASTRLGAVVLDSFRGLRTLQGIGAVVRRRDQLALAADRLDRTTLAIAKRAFLSGAIMEVVITFSIAADATYIGMSLLGYVSVPGAPTVNLFSGLLALLLCPMYFAPLRATAAAYHGRERAAAAVPTILGLLEASPEVEPAPRPDRPVTGVPVAVELVDLTLRFPSADAPVLEGVSLTAPACRWTAITGPSGIGKTTLLSLIAGAREPSAGTVRWVTPTGSVSPQLGGCVWIGQQTVILPGSIADNVAVARPTATRSEIAAAIEKAGLAGVVARLPEGLDTPLGEGGWGLSTGEARRVAIARAFLRDAQLWVLDEPTAHLDPDAEAAVVSALRVATVGRTVVVATHSPTVASSADLVLSLDGGRVHALRRSVAA
jgi:ATP-binding cassette subfamily C protein CydD